jgi:hypothetical protein
MQGELSYTRKKFYYHCIMAQGCSKITLVISIAFLLSGSYFVFGQENSTKRTLLGRIRGGKENIQDSIRKGSAGSTKFYVQKGGSKSQVVFQSASDSVQRIDTLGIKKSLLGKQDSIGEKNNTLDQIKQDTLRKRMVSLYPQLTYPISKDSGGVRLDSLFVKTTLTNHEDMIHSKAKEYVPGLEDSKAIFSEARRQSARYREFREANLDSASIKNQLEKHNLPQTDTAYLTKKAEAWADQKLKETDQVKMLESQMGAAEKLKQLQLAELEKIKQAQTIRDQISAQTVTDKITEKQEVIQQQIEKMNKYKGKLDHVHDLRFVPKIRPNQMKGKPWKERWVPGVLLHARKTDDTLEWFVAPELLYRLSGIISVGAGGMYRIRTMREPLFVWAQPIYGYRMIAQVNAYKGFYGRLEFESNNQLISTYKNEEVRVWKSGWLAGIGRTQRITSDLNGYFWVFYDFNREGNDFFRSAVFVKTGFQLNLSSDRKKLIKHVEEKAKNTFHREQSNLEKSLDQKAGRLKN